mmetsp:Transcript_73714/g.130134  ORF Transcript_73714/g.130134 Transcript_73714/m.130134 type:complete len:1375 (-) Transcript_73714:58-4182(-)
MAPKRGATVVPEAPVQPLTLEVSHAFGSHAGGTLRDSVMFGDMAGNYLAHPVGRQMAFRHLAGGEVNFAVESTGVVAVTACGVSRDRNLLAVCELCSTAPFTQVCIYELGLLASNEPVQTLEELGGAVGTIVAAAFSSVERATGSSDDPNSLLCLASSGSPSQIIIIDWKMNEIVGRCRVTDAMDRIAFNNMDSGMISVSCSKTLELWVIRDFPPPAEGEQPPEDRLETKDLRRLPEIAGLNEFAASFTDHAWLMPACGSLAASSEQGAVYIISSGTDPEEPAADRPSEELLPFVLCSIEAPFGAPLVGAAAKCIRCFLNGFIVGGSSGGLSVWMLDTSDEGDEVDAEDAVDGASPVYTHDCTARLAVANGSTVSCLDFVGGWEEGDIVVALENASITHLNISQVREADGKDVVESPIICGGFHSGAVNSLDMAVQRPLLVSSCVDSTIRVWNYQTGNCELCWTAPEEPVGIAIHPFGFFLAVGFVDRIRFMQILAKDLKLFSEISVKNVRHLRFSHGGHLIAAAQAKLVLIFNSRTLKRVATLRGHPKDVAAISFEPDDKSLTTIGEDGRLCEWSTQTWSLVSEQSPKGEALAVAAGPDQRAWAGIVDGESCVFRSFKRCAFKEEQDIVLHPTRQLSAMTTFCSSKEVAVLAGDLKGSLRVWAGLTGTMRTAEIGLHSNTCTAICMSLDGRTVATAGADGAIFIVQVDGLAEGPPPTAGSARAARASNMEVVMINRGEMQQRQDEIQELSAQTASLKTQLEEDAARLQSECRARVDEARRKDQEEVQSLRLKYESLQQASTAKERDNLRQMKAMEAMHIAAADDKEKHYDKKMRTDADRYVALEADLKEMEVRLQQARERFQRGFVQQQQKQQQELRRRGAEKDAEIQKIKDLIAFTQQRFDAMLEQDTGEAEMEKTQLRQKNQEELEQQHLVEYKLKKEQDLMLRGLDMMEKDRERITTEQREASLVAKNLKDEGEKMKHEVAVLKAERKEREATLRDKEVEIGAHKLKVQTLKKFKHVLDYRLREVTQSLKPKEEMIAQLHMQLHTLEQEFEKQLAMQKNMENMLAQKTAQCAHLSTEAEQRKEDLKQRERTIFKYTADLHALATTEQDTRNWHIGLKKIWRDHVDPTVFNKDEENSPPMMELNRQIQVMERKATTLAKKGKSSEETCKADIIHKTQENSLLIHELDELRVEKKALGKQLKELELRVRQAEQRLAEQASLGALPDAASPASRPPSRQLSKNLPKAVQDFFEEAPMAAKPALKGQKKVAHKDSVYHHTSDERAGVMKLMKTAEQNKDKIGMQRIQQKLLQDQLDSITQKKNPQMSASGLNSVLSPSPVDSPASPVVAAGAGMSAVRAAVAGAPTPEQISPGR